VNALRTIRIVVERLDDGTACVRDDVGGAKMIRMRVVRGGRAGRLPVRDALLDVCDECVAVPDILCACPSRHADTLILDRIELVRVVRRRGRTRLAHALHRVIVRVGGGAPLTHAEIMRFSRRNHAVLIVPEEGRSCCPDRAREIPAVVVRERCRRRPAEKCARACGFA
jgi:hypothetical protein